jgi:malonyl-CoA/methylmalonyl-CoA synthetase
MTAQARSLLQAWEYSPSDYLLHVLPLHHIHGIINALFTPLFAGSTIEFLFPFNATAVWQRFASPFHKSEESASSREPITFFTAVPTVYSRLLTSHKSLAPDLQESARDAISPANLRLCISGSAALPTPTKRAWTELSKGNVLLERYGMTEVGMALSCGLEVADRVDGSVGWPLPGVQARLVDANNGELIEHGKELDTEGRERDGEIQLRGPTIFTEYWRNPAATEKEFVAASDGQGPWFKTGDVAVRRKVEGAGLSSRKSQTDWANGPVYFIRGRASVDIIKSGGEKVSALEVERELLSLPHVTEAAVLGIQSGTWGQKVAAVVIIDKGQVPGGKWTALDMRKALRNRLANYKIPQIMKVVDHIPRNAMGKINKKALSQQLFVDDYSGDEGLNG